MSDNEGECEDVSAVGVSFGGGALKKRAYVPPTYQHLPSYHPQSGYQAAPAAAPRSAAPLQAASSSSASAPPDAGEVKCKCGIAARMQETKKEGPNKGRFFFACARGFRDPQECKFFMWKDEAERRAKQKDEFPPQSRREYSLSKVYTKNPEEPTHIGTDECSERGELAEKAFIAVAEAFGWQTQRASQYENLYQHRDVRIWKGKCARQGDFWVDIKSAKKLRRSDPDVQFDRLWIEVHGVRPNDPGWVIGGESALIAFETALGFQLVRRRALWEWIEAKIPKQPTLVTRPEEAVAGACYKRESRPHELSTIVTFAELKEFEAEMKARHPQFQLFGDTWNAPPSIWEPYKQRVTASLARARPPRASS